MYYLLWQTVATKIIVIELSSIIKKPALPASANNTSTQSTLTISISTTISPRRRLITPNRTKTAPSGIATCGSSVSLPHPHDADPSAPLTLPPAYFQRLQLPYDYHPTPSHNDQQQQLRHVDLYTTVHRRLPHGIRPLLCLYLRRSSSSI